MRDLATHCAGLPRLGDDVTAASPKNPYAATSQQTVVDAFQRWAQVGAASSSPEQHYSNFGYAVLGHAIGGAVDRPWADSAATLLDNLGAKAVWPGPPPYGQPCTEARDVRGRPVPWWDMGGYAPAGACTVTPAGFAALARGVLEAYHDSAHLLHHAVRHSMLPAGAVDGSGNMGLGWHLTGNSETLVAWHNGATGGSTAFLAVRPATSSAVGMVASGPPDDQIERLVASMLA